MENISTDQLKLLKGPVWQVAQQVNALPTGPTSHMGTSCCLHMIQFTAYDQGKHQKIMQAFGLLYPLRDLEEAPSSQLYFSLALAVVPIWEREPMN